jgi:Holliday junction resolvasome RuvABC ATP-dependent DNA helicase subunit
MSLATDDLFSADTLADAPLAERLRPRQLDEVVGQSHLLGPGKPLKLAFDAGKLHSMILWGPPGVGKTTLARLTAEAFGADFGADDWMVPAGVVGFVLMLTAIFARCPAYMLFGINSCKKKEA